MLIFLNKFETVKVGLSSFRLSFLPSKMMIFEMCFQVQSWFMWMVLVQTQELFKVKKVEWVKKTSVKKFLFSTSLRLLALSKVNSIHCLTRIHVLYTKRKKKKDIGRTFRAYHNLDTSHNLIIILRRNQKNPV